MRWGGEQKWALVILPQLVHRNQLPTYRYDKDGYSMDHLICQSISKPP